jgi:hypothetical protein
MRHPHMPQPQRKRDGISRSWWTRLCKMTAPSAEVLVDSLSRKGLIFPHLVGRHDVEKKAENRWKGVCICTLHRKEGQQ